MIKQKNYVTVSLYRNFESAEMLTPRKTQIPVLGLGSSVSTPDDGECSKLVKLFGSEWYIAGIEAEVLVVNTFEELKSENVSAQVKGKIVVFNQDWVTYGTTVQYRSHGNCP